MYSVRLPRLLGALGLVLAVAAIATLAVSSSSADVDAAAAPAQMAAPAAHQVISAKSLTWGDAPPSAQPGARIAVLNGDPSKAEAFTIRIKLPDNYRVPPHWHPTDEHLTIVQGTFMLGMGEKFDVAVMKAMVVGDYIAMPKEMRHFATTKGETIVQVHGTGPFTINYVNPADDPRTRKTPATK